MNILLVEDDGDIGAMLTRGFSAEGFAVTVVARAADAIEAARDNNPSAIVLDMMLPDGSGTDICRTLRDRGYTGPILFLSAKDEVRDRVDGLSAGADDYIVKPFLFDELLARLRTQLLRRRGHANERERLVVGRLVLDLPTRQVHYGEAHARLTQREAELLAMFMQGSNRPIARAEIFDRLWAQQGGVSLNVVDVYVGYLRGKLTDISRSGGPSITTVRGRGFMLELPQI